MSRVSIPVKIAKPFKPQTDVVGLEVGAGLKQGTPAVRLRKRDGKTELLAAGFLTLPSALPTSENGTLGEGAPFWTLPRPFRAPHAALAVNSPLAFLRHSSSGVIDETAEKRNAYRQVSRQTVPEAPPFVAGLPEFQAAWAARLLPEGHRPTACSIQVAAAAAMSGFTASPVFAEAAGTAVALFVYARATALASFQDGNLVLYREHPVGTDHLRDAICSEMRLEPALADAVLEDTLIDPTPAMGPILRPLYRQVEISSDYLLRRRKCPVERFCICGVTAGTQYWAKLFTRTMNQTLTFCSPFDGIDITAAAGLPQDLNAVAPLLTTAAGAARAVLEDV
jgi:hypothetical protein